MSTPLNTILSYFETGDFPTQEQFQASWESFWHKDETIPTNKVAGLDSQLQNKADKNIFEAHTSNPDSHTAYLAKKDASNLDNTNVQAWKNALGVGELPENIATVDNENKFGNVYSKDQSNERFLTFNDYVNDDRKIRADKIEALGLTTLIEATETSISEFAAHSGSYTFEDNDFIAIPDNNGNFGLHMFKGGNKTEVKNYLATGLSNITMAMVEGLQDALNEKMRKPSYNGNFFIRGLGPGPIYAPISPASNYLLSWDGSDFKESTMYYKDGRFGIGTKTPEAQLHLLGNVRSSAYAFDTNNEAKRDQITYDGSKFWGANNASVRRPFMFADYAAEVELWSSLTDAQKTDLKTIMNGGWSTGTMSVALITPPVVDISDKNYWISLKGANLNLNPTSYSLEIMANDGVTPIAIIPNSQVQLYTNGLDLSFYFNFKNIPRGSYKLRLWNGVANYLTSMTVNVVDKLQLINLNNLIWETKLYTPGTPGVVNIAGGAMSYVASYQNKPFAREAVIVAAMKSSELIPAGQNFSISGTFRLRDASNSAMNIVLGLISKDNNLSLNNNANFQTSINNNNLANYSKTVKGDNLTAIVTGNETEVIAGFTMARNGNLFTVIIEQGGKIAVGTKVGIEDALCLVSYINNTLNNDGIGADAGFNIQSCYIF
ncbi:hypothetical protein C1637_18605 [Chryseobacterium lactis]|uniref:Uncharacterized protein n=1 Tax=Chryseobacterium lactis TaxID=1241981 RepID=A0A3G6RMR7_CHRLC|nr:hypothetical protein [Chryseobacterium lactis]AZA84794.1 hypothetical protein EG342_24115 [Chryseobacterium lactis]AZB05183.1 hypothetical protein EG341_14995 [Chryseobacterium lactis]PNW12165.1 hypothetical protein C1637_18605 [Chryseobacterium lactis]